jgi:hypothetical protein
MRQKCHDKNCLVFANDSAIKTRAIDTDLGEKEISSLAARTSPTPQPTPTSLTTTTPGPPGASLQPSAHGKTVQYITSNHYNY